jgi:hypothetical protein
MKFLETQKAPKFSIMSITVTFLKLLSVVTRDWCENSYWFGNIGERHRHILGIRKGLEDYLDCSGSLQLQLLK